MDDVYKCPACLALVKIWEIDIDKLVLIEQDLLFPADYMKSLAADLLGFDADRAKGGA
jgi:hypothetical protein